MIIVHPPGCFISGFLNLKFASLFQILQFAVPVHRNTVRVDLIHIDLHDADLCLLIGVSVCRASLVKPLMGSFVQHKYRTVAVDGESHCFFRKVSGQVCDLRRQGIQIVHLFRSGKITVLNSLAILNGADAAFHIGITAVGSGQSNLHALRIIVNIRILHAGGYPVTVGRLIHDIKNVDLRRCQIHGKVIRNILLSRISGQVGILDIKGILSVRVVNHGGCVHVAAAGKSSQRRGSDSLSFQRGRYSRLHAGRVKIVFIDCHRGGA